ncbi:Rieske domain-containing protein [Meredithblackwellia eburnea MCA 4105]
MAPSIFSRNILSATPDIKSAAPVKSTDEGTYNLPASWYRSEEIYQLERRAIFSKQWLYACHTSRIPETGDYILFTVAGYNFFVIRDRQGQIGAFHNVCRHRAFPVLGSKKEGQVRPTTEEGKANVISCKYHGWSYTMKGALAKAPGFDDEQGFKPEENGLWDLRVHIDKFGLIWVNMDKSANAISFADQVGNYYEQERLKDFDFSQYKYEHSWGFDNCEYNWKTLCDNYNECYHCGTGHPGIAKTVDLTSYFVKCDANYIAHYAEPKPGVDGGHRQGGQVIPMFSFPYMSITIAPAYIYTMRVVPTGPQTTAMQYDVFRHKDASDELFNEIHNAFVQIEGEDKFLCTNVQRNMKAGTYNTGALHHKREKGVIYFQSMVKNALKSHWELEQKAGHRIYPALYQQKGETEEDMFCKQVEGECGSSDPKLQW